MLNLPSSTEFGRRVPKQKFYEHLDVSPEVKRLFIDQIKLITWANKLSPQTMNLGAGQTVTVKAGKTSAVCMALAQKQQTGRRQQQHGRKYKEKFFQRHFLQFIKSVPSRDTKSVSP